jgi:hypothetical protein
MIINQEEPNEKKKAHCAAFILRKIKKLFLCLSILAFNAARTSVLSPKVEAFAADADEDFSSSFHIFSSSSRKIAV